MFAAMFVADLSEKRTNTLLIEDIDADVFVEMLRFIYTDEVKNIKNLAAKLLVAADKYMLDLLKLKCEKVLAENITVENCEEFNHSFTIF